jgi:ABC-type branched-subunit amino acid transport system substrate-binding protein
VKFGTLASPCGQAPSGVTASIKAADAGTGTDKLYLGVANERSNTIPGSAGLLKEMWDSSVAFAKWCNDQGGIDGLQISLVDLDAQVLHVSTAMATACTDVFSLVGGGWAQDQLVFSQQAGTDFYKCKMIAFPGFTVSAQFSGASGVISAVPNPAYQRPTVWIRDLAKLYPDKMSKIIGVYGNVPTLKADEDQINAAASTVTGVQYDAIGANNWNGLAQQVISSGAQAVSFVGQPGGMSSLSQALKQQQWTGVMFADGNEYSPDLISDAGPAAAEGLVTQIDFHPFEEANRWPATKQYVDIMKKDGPPNAVIALLGQQAWSAWLYFATSAKSCIEGSGNGQLSRDCVRQAASKITTWTGGGLHPPTDPPANKAPECWMLMTVKSGKFVRLAPKLSSSTAKDGFDCAPLATVKGDFGTATPDPSYAKF